MASHHGLGRGIRPTGSMQRYHMISLLGPLHHGLSQHVHALAPFAHHLPFILLRIMESQNKNRNQIAEDEEMSEPELAGKKLTPPNHTMRVKLQLR